MKRCKICKREIKAGFTNGFGDFYVCPNCFEKFMDERYGRRAWMAVADDGCGGYYLASAFKSDGAIGKPFGTGIYWTEWEDAEN